MLKVLKFGGSSMADAHQLEKVRSIVEADPARRVVVVSAAGKRFKDDHKITDLLYLCHAHLQYGVSCDGIFDMVRSRYLEIRDELGLSTPLEAEFDALRAKMDKGISADELVPLRQELRLVERYVEIQNIRFSGAFALTVEVDEPLRDVPVPKLMLQPLVENAILHGFRDRSGGEIRISAYRTEEDLILTVRDNGCGVPEEVLAQYRDGAPRPGGHFGLHNVDAILRIRYGPDRGVRFVPVQGEGACIRITLPVFRKGEEPPC